MMPLALPLPRLPRFHTLSTSLPFSFFFHLLLHQSIHSVSDLPDACFNLINLGLTLALTLPNRIRYRKNTRLKLCNSYTSSAITLKTSSCNPETLSFPSSFRTLP